MRDQGLGGMFPQSEDQNTDEHQDSGSKETTDIKNPLAPDQLSLWLENAPTFSTISKEMSREGYAITFDDLSSFGVPSSLPSKQMDPDGIPCLEKGQSSGTKRVDASDSLKMQTNETTDLQEDGEKEMSDGCKPQKRTRCAEVHNLNERIRRRKLKDKMKVLRELIPNCNKRDKSSTLDDAINYIKILQHQVQMMSTGVCHPALRSPSTMVQQVQFPSFLQPAPLRDGMEYGICMGMGMGMSSMFPSRLLPRNQYGLFDPCLLVSTATSGVSATTSGTSTTDHLVDQNSENLFESPYPASFRSTVLADTSSSQGTK